jgi:hypothetical protein
MSVHCAVYNRSGFRGTADGMKDNKTAKKKKKKKKKKKPRKQENQTP